MTRLKKNASQFGISLMRQIPRNWNVKSGTYYKLILRMFNLTSLDEVVEQEAQRTSGNQVKEEPTHDSLQILELDISLNDVTLLDAQQLEHFPELRIFNASLNHIQRFGGVKKLLNLCSLELSHNEIKQVSLGLAMCHQLTSLNLAVNQLTDISSMPSLHSLQILTLDHNQLKSLNGVQALPALRELHVQHNHLTDLVAVSGCLQLMVLNAADNSIESLTSTIQTLTPLKQIQVLTLYNNPVEKESKYWISLSKLASLLFLDNIALRNVKESSQTDRKSATSVTPKNSQQKEKSFRVESLMDMARQAFAHHIAEKRKQKDESVARLNHQIRMIETSYSEYEERTLCDMNACLMYLSTIGESESHLFTQDYFRDVLSTPIPEKPWQQNDSSHLPVSDTRRTPGVDISSARSDTEILEPETASRMKPNYRNVRDTDEVLRNAYKELVTEQTRIN